jgi:ComF family protein
VSFLITPKNIFSAILDFFFPPECLGCGKEDFWICPDCRQKIKPDIRRLSTKTKNIRVIWALTDYHMPITEKTIRKIKFGYCQDILTDLRPFFEETLPQIPIPADAVLCPVPLHLFRKNERGFNQAKSIAEEFSRISKVPTQELLKRKRHTHPQTKLDGEKRRQNLLGAFCLRKKMDQKREKDSPIILVDDVTTTFSTLEECAKTLKKKGFTNISALVIARSI